jgi:hypothetical protein
MAKSLSIPFEQGWYVVYDKVCVDWKHQLKDAEEIVKLYKEGKRLPPTEGIWENLVNTANPYSAEKFEILDHEHIYKW